MQREREREKKERKREREREWDREEEKKIIDAARNFCPTRMKNWERV